MRDALERDASLFIALAYLGMLQPDALEPLRATREPDIVERILSVPPAPEPDYSRNLHAHTVQAPTRKPRGRWHPNMERDRPLADYGRGTHDPQAFVEFMEGKREFSPEIFGW